MPAESDVVLNVDEEDLPYEEDVLRNPYFLKSWIRYLDFKREAPPKVRNMNSTLIPTNIYERALRELPGSYKLWHAYLLERVVAVRGLRISDPAFETANNVFERALVFMHKMPRIWMDYCQFLVDQEKITRTRRTFDRALKSLPITQHDKIWKFIRKVDVPPQTACRVYRRYLKLEPDGVEEYIDYLTEVGYYDEAANLLAKAVNRDNFESRQGKTKHQLWMQLSDLISQHPKDIVSLRVDAIIRGGLRKFTDETGKLWTSLAEYYIQLAQFEKARDIFEEAVNTVVTVRDFSHIWEAYTTFEDSLVAAKMDMLGDTQAMEDEELDIEVEEEVADFDLLVARYEYLIERQPLLLSSVLLRQNPHNVYEWHKRVKLFTSAKKIVETFTTALATVDPLRAKGKPHTLWTAFARFYEDKGRLDDARKIYEKAVGVNFRTIDELAAIYADYAEMELRHHELENARQVLLRATVSPRRGAHVVREDDPVQKRVFKSVKLWCFLADLEESMGTFQTTKAVYDKVLDLRVATPQLVLNFAAWLEENKHFEEAFKAYEKGVALFNFPYVHDLNKFVKRYGGLKLERARDLFEQVLEKVPTKDSKTFYVMYAKLEEEYGLARHAMAVYDRACKTVAEEDRYSMYLLYISRATEFFGITHTREIFMRATESLPEKFVKDICLKFADMERKLGEIDRARAIYTHAAQYCDPKTETTFWQIWYDFEKPVGGHGNVDTFREMLRIKRSIQAQYNNQINIEQMLAAAKKADAEDSTKTQTDIMGALEKHAQTHITSAAMPKPPAHEPQTDAEKEQAFVDEISGLNPEEIVIREEGEDEETFEETNTIEEVAIPSAVFGAAAEKAAEIKAKDKERTGDTDDEDEEEEQEEEKPKRGAKGKGAASNKRKRPSNK